ncbi:uncharacterized protein V2V93DRAFT_374351 [Kockiozyma suomiensis]|uniref:uncharacterized protein n=1 Tax=Kockiozyma suomiensis TaxID=1337062 RepID=UPI003342E8B4
MLRRALLRAVLRPPASRTLVRYKSSATEVSMSPVDVDEHFIGSPTADFDMLFDQNPSLAESQNQSQKHQNRSKPSLRQWTQAATDPQTLLAEITTGHQDNPAFRTMLQIVTSDIYHVTKMYEANPPRKESGNVWAVDPAAIGFAFIRRFVMLDAPDAAIKVWNDMRAMKMLQNPPIALWNAYFVAIVRSQTMTKQNSNSSMTPAELDADSSLKSSKTPRARELAVINDTFQGMLSRQKVSATSYWILIDAYFRLHKSNLAEGLLRKIHNGKLKVNENDGTTTLRPSQVLYDIFIKWNLKLNRPEKARQFFDMSLKNPNIARNAEMFNMMLAHYIRDKNDFESARNILLLMEEHGVAKDSTTYSILLYATFHDLALDIVPVDENNKPLFYMISKKRSLSEEAKKRGNEALRSILDEMRENKIEMTSHICHTVVVGLIDVSNDMYLVDIFVESVQKSKTVKLMRKTLVVLLEGHIRQGSIQHALTLYRKILPMYKMRRNVKLLDGLMQRLIVESETRLAFDLFYEFLEDQSTFDRPTLRSCSILIRASYALPEFLSDVERVIEYMQACDEMPLKNSSLHVCMQRFMNFGGKIDMDYMQAIQEQGAKRGQHQKG